MELEEKPKSKFPAFPFEPYPIQMDFMNSLYNSLQQRQGGIAILESPTGTGKTLSIICSALQWLLDRRQHTQSHNGGGSFSNDDEEPAWMRDFVAADNDKKTKKPGFGSVGSDKGNSRKPLDEEDEFLVEEYESEEEREGATLTKRKANAAASFSSSDEEEDDDKEEEVLKIYYCSRTHSQLSQFVKELKRTPFASQLKVISLGSRKNLCINSDVLKLGNLSWINERCLELQQNKKQGVSKKIQGDGGRICRNKVSSGCPMLNKHKLQKQFRNELAQHGAQDIEDLVRLGSKIGTCPYYGSRSMVPAADLVILPYQSLLLKSARESLSLNLKNSVVIIDEAHNLADSLTNMYNTKITLSQLDQVHSHLELYFDRFRSRLGASNRRYIQTLMVLSRAFLQLLLGDKDSCSSCHTENLSRERSVCDSSMTINDFLFSLDIDNINLVKLQLYVKESNIVNKVSGYGTKIVNSQRTSMLAGGGNSDGEGSSLSSIQALVNLLLSLTNNDSDGRIIISRQTPKFPGQQEGYLKYVMLAGEKIFSEVVDQAHAVVLAGGTLQPIEETRERLFPFLSPERLHFFSCSHIVPPESILPIVVSRGPSGRSFDFSFNSRSSPSMIDELGHLLCNLVVVVPEGIVVFFSSFEYEEQVYDAWKASGILGRILKKKRVFREPRSNVDVEALLKEYKETVTLSSVDSKDHLVVSHGALLLAVVGGKISEGINFSDGMGRCVVMVGLPYPSPSDIELMERIKHIEGLGGSNTTRPANFSISETYSENSVQSGFDILRSCKRRGREYYENLCMKAVNQSIGRAIRHLNDYAAILLVDSRYASEQSVRGFSHQTNKLPQWIKNRLVSATKNYGEVHRLLLQFFKFNKQRGCHWEAPSQQ